MRIGDRQLVLAFFGFLALIGIGGAWIVLSIRQRPLIEFEQQRLGTHLRFAYQKYHHSRGVWPQQPEEAIRLYTQEAPQLPDFYQKAKKDWDVTVRVKEGPQTTMTLEFKSPSPRKIDLPLTRPD